MSKRTRRRAQARRSRSPSDMTGVTSSGRRMADMAERKREAPKPASEWQGLMNTVMPRLVRIADANGDWDGPLLPIMNSVVKELGLPTSGSSLSERLQAIGWIEDTGLVPGTSTTHRYHFRREAVSLSLAGEADLKVRRAKRRQRAASREHAAAQAQQTPAPPVVRRVDKDDLIPGKQVMVVGSERPKLTIPGKPAETDPYVIKAEQIRRIEMGELEAAHQDVEMLKAQLKEVGEDRDRARELSVRLRSDLTKTERLIEILLSGDSDTIAMIRTAIEYDRANRDAADL